VAAVAQAHGLNANLVHKWRRGRDAKRRLSSTAGVRSAEVAERPMPSAAALPAAATLTDAAPSFVPVQLQMPRAAPADIRLELRRGAATVIVTWPAQEAAACGSWLREWLR
jgi:transposase